MPRTLACALALLGLAGCSGGGGATLGGGSSTHGGGSSGGSSGSAYGTDGGLSGDDASTPTGDDGSATAAAPANWSCTAAACCPPATVLGGYSTQCVSCIQTMCSSQLQQCQTSTCMACEKPVFDCESASCSSACGGGGSSSSGGGGDGGGTASGSCAGLMTCCSLVASFAPSQAASCTSIAQSNNQTSCQQIIAMLPATLSMYCH